MARSHRSHKREHSLRDNDLEHPYKRGRHENAYQVHARHRSVENTVKPQALIDRDHRELSGDNDYVRMWLAQLKDEGEYEVKRGPGVKTGLDMRGQPGNEQHDFFLSARKNEEQLRNSYTRPKPKRSRSADSSLLHVRLKPAAEHGSLDIHDVDPTVRSKGGANTFSKRHKDETYQDVHSSIFGPSQVQTDSKKFEKRPRRKTREDKYEPRKQPTKTNSEKLTKKRHEKKGDRRKAARKASEDLRDNFNSKKISQERLTVRSSTGLGIFKNGRASSPTRRRGLPDLAFSEMDFLRRSGKNFSANDNFGLSKDRIKGKRKASREQDEIATFFMPPKTPVREDLSTSGAQTSPTSLHAASLYGKQMGIGHDLNHHYLHSDVSRSAYIEESTAEPHNNSTQQVFCPLPREPTLQSQYKQNVRETVGDTRRLNSKPTTVVSWSESHVSPSATVASRREGEKTRRLQSSTPDSVRESIERTGVFKDTGINCKIGRQREQLHRGTESALAGNKTEHVIPAIASQRKGITPTSNHGQYNISMANNDDAKHSDSMPLQTLRTPLPNNRSPGLSVDTMQQTQPNPLPEKLGENPIENGGRSVVVYYEPNRGRYGEEEDCSNRQAAVRAEPVQPSLTRQQLAQNARVKRPSTTVPVISGVSGIVTNDNHRDQIERTESAPVKFPSMVERGGAEMTVQDDAGASNQGGTAMLQSQRSNAALQTVIQELPSESHLTRPNRSMPDEDRNVEQEHPTKETPITEMYSTKPIEPTNAEFFERNHQLRHDETVHITPHIQRSPLIRFPSLYVRQLEHEEQRQQPDNFFQTQFYTDQEHHVAIEGTFEQEITNNEALYQGLLATPADIGSVDPNSVDDLTFKEMGQYVPELWLDDLDHMNGQQAQFFDLDPYSKWTEEQGQLCAEAMQDPQRDLEYTTDHNPSGDFAFAGFEENYFDRLEQSLNLDQRFWRPFQRG